MKHWLFGVFFFIGVMHSSLASETLTFVSELAERQLTAADRQWIELQVSSNSLVSVALNNQNHEAWLDIKPRSINETFQPDFEQNVTASFNAPKNASTYPVLDRGISVEQSGQRITLPLLRIPDFNNEPLEIRLRYWHKKDLTPIRFLVQSAQQEVGWSDFEVALLLRRYANTLLPEPMQVPFLASYWQQAGYQVQLVSDQERLSLFYRVPTAVVAWPMVRHLNRNWVTLEADIQSDVSLPANMMLTGQALRFSSLNDRAFSTTFRSVVYRFNTGENEENIQFELPVYWSRIKRSPLPHLEQYRTQLPNYFWEQMALVHTAETISGKAVRFAQWLKSDFEVTDEDLSIQQSLLLKKQNRETMFVLLAAWWSFLSSQPAALVVDNEQHYLALRLKEGIQVDSGVENRGHRWWLWTTSLNTAQPSLNTAKWRFLP